ncbi:MAG: hypothetical protein JXA03_14270 [Bacteroidales bacterium]|nr:hypothetical protein [Bacteroidales bacterium]
MKTAPLFFLSFLIYGFSHAQSIERDVVASSGDYFENGGISLSWTLGELATETYMAGNIILTQGFQQPGATSQGFSLDLKVFLNGPFNGATMNATLNTNGYVPLNQPYNANPWFYTGTESVAAIPSANVVDWVLIELRDAANAASATPSTMIERKAAFLLQNGIVTGLDGSNPLASTATITQNLFVVVWHRHHLGIMSANPLVLSGGTYSYDFTTGSGQVAGGSLGYKQLAPGIWGMVGGDGNSDDQVNSLDKNDIWAPQAGFSGYVQGDFNMDSQVNNNDKNDIWAVNAGTGGQVPDLGYKCGVPR